MSKRKSSRAENTERSSGDRVGRVERKAAVTTWRKPRPLEERVRKDSLDAQVRAARKTARPGRSALEDWRWLAQLHRRTGRDALTRILVTPLASLMTVLVLGLALALPAGLCVVLDAFRLVLGEGHAGSVRLTLYLEQGVSDERARDMKTQLAQDPAVLQAIYITPEQGAEDFRRYSGLGSALDLLDVNPLPGVIELEPVEAAAEAVQNLHERLKTLSGVSQVRLDTVWLERLVALLEVGERLLQGGGALIGLMLLLVVGNTIRLLVANRRDEIRVIKLVGGSDGFVLLPFLYTGFWYGLTGGCLAWLITAALRFLVSDSMAQLAGLYHVPFQPGLPDWHLSLFLLAGGCAVGVLGALLAAWSQIRRIRP